MKASLLAALTGLILASPFNAPAAELVLSTPKVLPDSTFELTFENRMIAEDQVGAVAGTSPLVVEPPVQGEFTWTSTRSGHFHFTETPALGTTYAFKLAANLKDAEGNKVAAQDLGEYATKDFVIANQWRDYPYADGNSAQRRPTWLLQFNDEVDAAKVAQAFVLRDKGNQEVAVEARAATHEDFARRYNPAIIPTWQELADGVTPVSDKDAAPRPNAVLLMSKELLPVGQNWKLYARTDLMNKAGTAALVLDEPLEWGNIIPLQVKEVITQNHFDHANEIIITLNKTLNDRNLSQEELNARAAQFIKISPAVPDMKIRAEYNRISISGGYELHTPYDVTVIEGLVGGDGLLLEAPSTSTVTFKPSPAFVSTTATASAQMAHGNGVLDIYAANYKALNIRVKKLAQGELIKARSLYQTAYDMHGKPEDARKSVEQTRFEDFPGEVVYENSVPNDKPLEKATLHHLQWKEILGEIPAAPVFMEITAEPQEGAPAGTIVSRAIVEFTDIGLLVKNNHREALVYAFSLKTGQPLPGVELTLMDEEGGFLSHAVTDASGVAVGKGNDIVWVLARKGDDTTSLNANNYESRINLWGQNINVGWGNPWREHYDTLIFSDRPVYKPGETAHVKAITRLRSGDQLMLSRKPITGTLVVSDPRNREILRKEVTFSANGTWADSIALPASAVGWFSLRIIYPSLKPAGLNDEEGDEEAAYLDLRVDEYKPNSFEIAMNGQQHQVHPDRITQPISAKYYMGKPLTKATVSWSANLDGVYYPPEKYSDYHFGDVSTWWNYGKDSDDETAADDEEDPASNWSAYGEITLNDSGEAEINMPSVPDHRASLPQNVTVWAEVTDINQQTITSTATFQVPGADFIIGVKKSAWYATMGAPLDFEVVAITPEGQPFTQQVPVELTFERMEWNTVRVEGAGGAITTKNQSTLIEEARSTVTLSSANQQAATAMHAFTPQKSGTYFVTATALDPNGKKVLSRSAFYSIGGDRYPWSWDDGARVTLQPDKTKVKAGDEVTVVVKTPIAGRALVSVERNKVHRHFLADISPENPVIKIKTEDADAPNAFISVIIIRGADDSKQPDAMPEYKVGYCDIQVESPKKKLLVDITPSQDPILPAGELTINATVKDAAQAPVAGADVTLYAVDEGVLSLMAYETPNPFEHFYQQSALGVRSYTGLDSLIPESLKDRYRGNKGIMIGGGGDEAGADAALRKNFVATAVWQATLVTDAQGQVTTTFKVPDNLTRYRIMAVAAHGADRFGSGQSSFTINKPLMVEPAVPRFAHRGDEMLVKAVVHNTTPHKGQVEIELKLDETTELMNEDRPFALVSQLKGREVAADGRQERRVITLEPNQTTAVAFPVRFVKTGTAQWEWSAKTTQWDGKALADRVESSFAVAYPAPSLREVHYVSLTSKTNTQDLLRKINPQLTEGEGTWTLNLSRSRMTETRDALEHVLQYPYGCVEQTTSRVLPWLALGRYEPLFPDLLQKDKVRSAIQRGTERLITMQTESGGLAYWPGGDTPELWASAYGGFALVKAREWGATIPDETLNQLTAWMIDHLSTLELSKTDKHYDMENAALALYTLAKAGKPQPAYQTTLYSRRKNLSETARAFLALSMCLTDAPAAQIRELITPPAKPAKSANRYWLGNSTADGLRLIACAHVGMTRESEQIINELFKARGSDGHWGTTFSNAWVLLGLSTNERLPKTDAPLAVQIAANGAVQEHNLPSHLSTLSATGELVKDKALSPVSVQIPDGATLRGRLAVTAYPDVSTYKATNKGFTLKRRYERMTPTGGLEPAEQLRVGDLIVTTLEIEVHRPNRYLAIEDCLPSVFEPINPEFATQNANEDAEQEADKNAWMTDHRELRHDRALFFTNDWSQLGKFELRYLARVIAEGDVIAPPARIEAMYEPDHYGLSDIDHVVTLPSVPENVVKK